MMVGLSKWLWLSFVATGCITSTTPKTTKAQSSSVSAQRQLRSLVAANTSTSTQRFLSDITFGAPYYHAIPWNDTTSVNSEIFRSPILLTNGVHLTGQSGKVGDTMIYRIDTGGADKLVDCVLTATSADLAGASKSSRCEMSMRSTAQAHMVNILFSPTSNVNDLTIVCTIQENSVPVPVPVPSQPNPTPAPTECPKPPGCFSKDMTVQVKGKGAVAMKDLSVGDHVLVVRPTNSRRDQIRLESHHHDDDSRSYEPVYGFGHYSPTVSMEYLSIYTTYFHNDNEDEMMPPLELTGTHLIYMHGQRDPIRADTLQVGDQILVAVDSRIANSDNNNDNSSSNNATTIYEQQFATTTITRIESVVRHGAYLPLTPSGTIVVNGIAASGYVSISHHAPSIVLDKFVTQIGISEHDMFHQWLTPYRVMCLYLVPDYSYCHYDGMFTSQGILKWLSWGQDFAEFGNSQHPLLQILGFGATLCWLAVWAMIEWLLYQQQQRCSLFFSSCVGILAATTTVMMTMNKRKQVLAQRKGDQTTLNKRGPVL